MPAIPLSKAMIVWTPNREPWTNTAEAAAPGSIAVVEHPDDRGAWTRYPCSVGACSTDWQEGNDEYRLQELANLVGQLIGADRMNPDHVIEALRAIDGYERLAGLTPQPR